MSKTFTKDDVAGHKTTEDLWIIVDDDVYDLTKFQVSRTSSQRRSAVANDLESGRAPWW